MSCGAATQLAWRNTLVCLASLQAFLFSGIVYGWASLYTLFLETGVYADRCDVPGEICDDQKTALQFIYTVASSANLAAQLPWGMLLDRFGPRVCCAMSSFGVIIGMAILGFSSVSTFDGYMLGVVTFAASGPGVQISLFHISELFPHQKSTVLALISGAFQLGFIVFLLFRVVLHLLGLTLHQMALMYCVPLAVVLVVGILVWPDEPCKSVIAVDQEDPATHHLRVREAEVASQTLSQQLFSPDFLGVLIWMTVCLFWANFYVGTVVEQIFVKSGEQPVPTRFYTNIFNLLLPVGVVGIPIFGYITDRCGFTYSIATTSGLAILFAGVNLSQNLPMQVATFVFYSFFRTFLFSLMFAYLASEFGFVNFGRLSGILLGIGGGIGMLQHPLLVYQNSSDSAVNAVNIVQFGSLCLTVLFAVYHYRREKAGKDVADLERAYYTPFFGEGALIGGQQRQSKSDSDLQTLLDQRRQPRDLEAAGSDGLSMTGPMSSRRLASSSGGTSSGSGGGGGGGAPGVGDSLLRPPSAMDRGRSKSSGDTSNYGSMAAGGSGAATGAPQQQWQSFQSGGGGSSGGVGGARGSRAASTASTASASGRPGATSISVGADFDYRRSRE